MKCLRYWENEKPKNGVRYRFMGFYKNNQN